MASGKDAESDVKLCEPEIPKSFVDGCKFIKWDEDSGSCVPVTLYVDKLGDVIYWKDQNKESDFLDISSIKDTRTGRYSRQPKDSRLKDSLSYGEMESTFEEKCVSICYGTDFVSINWINFSAPSKEVAKEWCDVLLECAYNMKSLNVSPMRQLRKIYTKLGLLTDKHGKVPVKSILKQLCQHRDDRKRVMKALEAASLPSGKDDSINFQKLDFSDFLRFYGNLVVRPEIDEILEELGSKRKPYVTVDQFEKFINSTQRDPRLNELLHQVHNRKDILELINKFEPSHSLAQKGHLSVLGLLHYLMSEENACIPDKNVAPSHKMSEPLCHYFINSSHNTYLTGHQLTSRSSVEIYRQVLLSGCRCVELDCWDGKSDAEEPIITHGYTMCTEVLFKDVIEAIAESAFKTSPYPVILSFENHCNQKQQAKMAKYCRDIFGSMLLIEEIVTHPLVPGKALPPPDKLLYKIIVKNRKKHFSKKGKVQGKRNASQTVKTETDTKKPVEVKSNSVSSETTANSNGRTDQDGEVESDSSDESDSEEQLTEEQERQRQKVKSDRGTAAKEAEAGREMSNLVNYVQPVHFHNFETSKKRNHSYEMTSFVETQAMSLLKEYPVEFVNYNQMQLSRIYPKGTRVDSRNYMPQLFWNAGCQLVALNFQHLDLAMQLNQAIFEYNGRTGYLLKPELMRRPDRHLDPFAESTVDGVVAAKVTVKVISGQMISERRVSSYVEAEMYGLPADTVRKKCRTRTVPANGINPLYTPVHAEPFVFKKIILPDLAVIRLAVCEESGKLLGHRVLPVVGLRPGYRHIQLRNEINQSLGAASLFVCISVSDYVPDAYQGFADALANPIAYQSALEKHAQQLSVLTEGFEEADEENPSSSEDTPQPAGLASAGQSSVTRAATPSRPTGDSPTNTKPMSPEAATKLSPTPLTLNNFTGTVSSQQSDPASGMVQELDQRLQDAIRSGNMTAYDESIESSKLEVTRLKETSRKYKKIERKMQKELGTLERKHSKKINSRVELHQLQEEQLVLKHIKRTSKKKATPKSSSSNDVAHNADPNGIDHADHAISQLKKSQNRDLRHMLKSKKQAEIQTKEKHHASMFTALLDSLKTMHSLQKQMLDRLHNQQVSELTQRLEQQSLQEMKQLARATQDKHELQRRKREAKKKHVQTGVTHRTNLLDVFERRKQELNDQQEKEEELLNQHAIQHREDMLSELAAEYPSSEDEAGMVHSMSMF